MSKPTTRPAVPPVSPIYLGTTESGLNYIASTELTMEQLTKAQDILVRILARKEAAKALSSQAERRKGDPLLRSHPKQRAG